VWTRSDCCHDCCSQSDLVSVVTCTAVKQSCVDVHTFSQCAAHDVSGVVASSPSQEISGRPL